MARAWRWAEQGDLLSRRPRARLGADRGRGERAADRRLRRLQERARSDLRAAFELVTCDVFITEATFGLPVFRHGDVDAEIAKLLHSLALFRERAHLVGAYSLGKAQRRSRSSATPATTSRSFFTALEKITRYYADRGIALGRIELARTASKAELAGAVTLCPPTALKEVWSRRFPDPVTCFASGWMRVRAARQHLVELPLVISDHADWDGLTATVAATGASDIWVTHGQEEALVHWSITRGLQARPLDIVGYGDEAIPTA